MSYPSVAGIWMRTTDFIFLRALTKPCCWPFWKAWFKGCWSSLVDQRSIITFTLAFLRVAYWFPSLSRQLPLAQLQEQLANRQTALWPEV